MGQIPRSTERISSCQRWRTSQGYRQSRAVEKW